MFPKTSNDSAEPVIEIIVPAKDSTKTRLQEERPKRIFSFAGKALGRFVLEKLMGAGFVQTRRGLLEHLREGKLTMREYAVYSLLLMLADKATGVWWGCSIAISSKFGAGDFGERQAQDTLRSLEQKGYIKSFRKQGQRGNQPILIDKYEVTFGGLSGKRANAVKTTSYDDIVYEDGDETSGETRGEVSGDPRGETRGLSIPQYHKPRTSGVERVEASPAANGSANGENTEIVSQAENLVRYIYKDILESKENPSERTLTIAVDKTIEALQSRSYERLKGLLDYARKTKFWYERIFGAEYPVSLFIKSIPAIEEQAQEAAKKAARKAHVENKAAQMGAKPKTAIPAQPAVKSEWLKEEED